MHILGTAGHVDHGKSSLVRALTGTDPDRWIEEKLRGMTLDLGFAHLRFDDGIEAGIVDVPGHERFLHNMLAGAAGMELLLLVIAANEGPKPQTIEHLAILSYLNVQRAIVVLTKTDLVDREEFDMVKHLVTDAVRGTVAEGAPILGVSTVTGSGLDELRAAIHDALRTLPPRAPQAPAYLPVDRVFALPGHGTIVTGTLMQGHMRVGDTLSLSPSGKLVRVRSLQVFGERRERVDGGARVAANLPGVEVAEVRRGAVLASAQFKPQRSFRVTFRPYAPAIQLLKRRTPVRVYIGAAELLGVLQFETVPESAAEDTLAVLNLRGETIGLPGAAFVVRRLSPKNLLGGGTVQGTNASGSDADRGNEVVDRVLAALEEAGYEGASAARIGATANLREDIAEQTLFTLGEVGHVLRLARPDAFVSAKIVDVLEGRIVEALQQREAVAPWAVGATALSLARELGMPEPAALRMLNLLAENDRIVALSGYYATPGFEPRLTTEQREFFERETRCDPALPFLPASLGELVAKFGSSRIKGVSQAFDTLVVSGALVKVGDSVYRGTQIAEVRRRLEEALRVQRQITASGFRDIVGTSRKYAVPLLEWFDATGVTVRSGDVRMLRERRAASTKGA